MKGFLGNSWRNSWGNLEHFYLDLNEGNLNKYLKVFVDEIFGGIREAIVQSSFGEVLRKPNQIASKKSNFF